MIVRGDAVAMELLGDVRGVLGAVGNRALDLALPATCAGCRREGSALCWECLPALDARLDAVPGTPIGLPADIPSPLLQLEWAAPFTGVTRRGIHALKYGGERRLARPMGAAVARRMARAAMTGDVLVPVPASPDRVRDRGYDQAALIAQEVGRHRRLPVRAALRRTRVTTAQFDLDRAARAANLGGVFAVTDRAAIANRWVILVDDVMTTGATLASCAMALLDGGALAVSAIAVARER